MSIDCADGSDEDSNCASLKSKQICTSKCPEPATCVYLPKDAECVCPKGFTFNKTTNQCEVSILSINLNCFRLALILNSFFRILMNV